MRMQYAALADAHVFADNAVCADFDIAADARCGGDDSGGVDVTHASSFLQNPF